MESNRRGFVGFFSGLFCGMFGANAVTAEASTTKLIQGELIKLEAREALPLASIPDSSFKPIEIERGKVYVIECRDCLTSSQYERLNAAWERVTGSHCVILDQGLTVARQSPPSITINAMDAASFESYLLQNSDAVAKALTEAVYRGSDLTALHQV